MRIEYVSHATMCVETEDAKILFDPWWDGASYNGQWNVFPKPINVDQCLDADFIMISHGHEDHLHHQTLANYKNKKAHLFYPFQWQKGIEGYFNELGFSKVTEGITGKKYKISKSTTVTYLANGLDSIIIVDDGKEVMVNINDSLHAHHKNVIAAFCVEIKKIIGRKIDYVFCGFGGASWFPNNFHVEGKNDIEIGEVREQVFAHNFCAIVNQLQPKYAVPFAADFALLRADQRWINTTRFDREKLQAYYSEFFEDKEIVKTMYSGDVIKDGTFHLSSPYRKELEENGELESLIDTQYKNEIQDRNDFSSNGKIDMDKLCSNIVDNLNGRSFLFGEDKLKQVKYSLEFLGEEKTKFLNIEFKNNKFEGIRSEKISDASFLVIKGEARIFEYSISSPWGGDAITIGYGANMHIFDKSIFEKGLDSICIQLITRHPIASQTAKKDLYRTAKYFATNKLMSKFAVKRLIKGDSTKSNSYNRDYWLNKTKCDVCKVCDIPLLTAEFAEKL